MVFRLTLGVLADRSDQLRSGKAGTRSLAYGPDAALIKVAYDATAGVPMRGGD